MRRSMPISAAAILLVFSMSWAGEFEDLVSKAKEAFESGKYAEAAQLYEKAFGLAEPNGSQLYDLARCWSLAGEADKAFDSLEKSRLENGFNLGRLKDDEDLSSLRGDARWGELMVRYCDSKYDVENPGPYDHFGAAECYAVAGETAKAMEKLRLALDAGFMNRQLMIEWSDDISALRSEPEWESLVGRLEDNIKKAENSLPEKHAVIERVKLPQPRFDGGISVEKALSERRSQRNFTGDPVTLADCSQLLWSAYGVTLKGESMPAFLRGGLKTAPSAGARYPLEVYLVAYGVSDLPDGVYLYSPEDHSIGKIAEGDIRDRLSGACWDQDWLKKAAVSIVYSAVYSRNMEKYGERGRERYVCMDLGHSAENVYLQCGSMGLGTCAIGAFVDIELKVAVGMTREEEPLYVMPVGHPASN